MAKKDQPGLVLWARKWLVLAFVVLFTGTAYVVVKQQTPVYESSAKMAVTFPGGETSFDQLQANQALARSLVDLIGSRNVADFVAERNPSLDLVPNDVVDQMSFDQITETLLIKITAEDPDPALSRDLANAWAEGFELYARSRLAALSPGSEVLIAERAVLPDEPARPRPLLTVAIALLVSLALACGAALVHARFDTRLDVDDLADDFGLPLLATLPRRGRSKVSGERFDEAVRVLRTNLQFASDRPLRSLSVTSTGEAEGKSTVVAALAWSFALMSLTKGEVLVVDADLRRPALLERLKVVPQGTRGLSTWLQRQSSFEACTQSTDVEALVVMPPGPLPSNPSTLLGYATSQEKLKALSERANIVLFDTPPVAAGADAQLVAAASDGVVVVVDLAKVRRRDLESTLQSLRRVRANVVGLVVNRYATDDRSTSAYGYAPSAADRPLEPELPRRTIRSLRSS